MNHQAMQIADRIAQLHHEHLIQAGRTRRLAQHAATRAAPTEPARTVLVRRRARRATGLASACLVLATGGLTAYALTAGDGASEPVTPPTPRTEHVVGRHLWAV